MVGSINFRNMEVQVDLKKILKKGILDSELDFHRASLIDRQLRLLVKDHPELSGSRKKLRAIIKEYEDRNWAQLPIPENKLIESDLAEEIAERERDFLQNRKKVIRAKLKGFGMTQRQLGAVLGHNSESYMSELISGVTPFTVNDLVLIHKILDIPLSDLVPTVIHTGTVSRVVRVLSSMDLPGLRSKIAELAP
ncbi:MAG: helix-turn-helix domain-containing protein [Sphingobacterium sp.]